MIYNNKIICIPKNDSNKRFLLGQHGSRELLNYLVEINMNYLCIGLTAKDNPFHPAPIGINRFLCGINNIKLQPFKKKS